MSFTANEIDAQFFQMIHQLIKSQRRSERRGHPRDTFTSTQRIALLRDDKTPEEKDFFDVRCNDLTPSGFSFFINEKPDFEQLVIAFEGSSGMIHIHAEVRHSRKVLLFADSGRVEAFDYQAGCNEYYDTKRKSAVREEGTPVFLVGCCFTGRFN